MKKLSLVILILSSALAAAAQTKTVTNKDLEKYSRARVEADRELAEKYAAMGFSSIAEANKYFEEKRARENEIIDRLSRERASQNDFAAEADALRRQIAALEAQINYLNNQPGAVYYAQPPVYAYGSAPFGFGGGYYAPSRPRRPRAINSPRELNPVIPSGSSVAVPARRPRTDNAPFGFGSGSNYGGYYRGGYGAPIGGSYYANNGYYTNNSGTQIVYLQRQRAGLLVRWRLLEDRARRAGFKLY